MNERCNAVQSVGLSRKWNEKKEEKEGTDRAKRLKVQKGKEQNETKTEIEFGTQAHRIGTKIPHYL